ncbi:MAG TPA: TetR/AcrR family transcriptional regulator [Clostridia bacterium]|jgi:AcrR family transcriptional regulator|nr:TetR/AcrR family transcriptional regulator [Clostridia bacterium]
MGKNNTKNQELRKLSTDKILESALSEYVNCGYAGADMDRISKNANVAKGLMYYYFQSKKDLFQQLFRMMFDNAILLTQEILSNRKDRTPVENLAYYLYAIFEENKKTPMFIRFFLRFPFDTYAVFGPDNWQEGIQGSALQIKALREIINEGIEQKQIPFMDAENAANSFWTVFVANLFRYSKMMAGKEQDEMSSMQNVAGFCFRGLGIDENVWKSALESVIYAKGQKNEKGD